jgi:hypothetical protein
MSDVSVTSTSTDKYLIFAKIIYYERPKFFQDKLHFLNPMQY